MIRLLTGDILLSKVQVIAHGVAPNDPHAQGLAHALREQWPAMYKHFRHYCQTRHPESGSAWTWSGAGDTHLVSLFTQDGSYDLRLRSASRWGGCGPRVGERPLD